MLAASYAAFQPLARNSRRLPRQRSRRARTNSLLPHHFRPKRGFISILVLAEVDGPARSRSDPNLPGTALDLRDRRDAPSLRGSLSDSAGPVRPTLHSYRHPRPLPPFQRKPPPRRGRPPTTPPDG